MEIDDKQLINGKILPFEEYEHYFEALKLNEVETLEHIYLQVSSKEQKLILNGQFEFSPDISLCNTYLVRMSRPLLVAVMMGSTDAVEYLLKQGADVFQENCFLENIFHSLVAATSLQLISEETSVSVFNWLLGKLDKPLVEQLLMHENADGLRPLEMAAHLGCIFLYEAIHLTPGVYLVKSRKSGVILEEWIDITEYELRKPGHRRNKSPLLLFSFLDKNRHGDVVHCDTITFWLDKKLQMAKKMGLSHLITLLFFNFFHWISITRADSAVDSRLEGDEIGGVQNYT